MHIYCYYMCQKIYIYLNESHINVKLSVNFHYVIEDFIAFSSFGAIVFKKNI